MSKQTKERYISPYDYILKSKTATLSISVFCILMGLFFIFVIGNYKYVAKTDAVSYSGEFEEYNTLGRNERTISFKDGSMYSLYPHTETEEFKDRMLLLEKGTKLYILVNPNHDYVVEIKTETEELLNFDDSQAEIDSDVKGYAVIGIVVCVCGVLLIVYVIGNSVYSKKEKETQNTKHKKRIEGENNSTMRPADLSVKSKILLSAEKDGYNIVYRRVKNVNELVVNGIVYDEKKGFFEFAHKLSVDLGGHTIEAGLDDDEYSYINFDGECIAFDERMI